MIDMHREDYPISVLCETLEVSIRGYYAWKKRPMSQHQREDTQLAERIQVVYHTTREVYGSPRLHAEMQEQGIRCSQKRIARLMREMGLSPRRPPHRTLTTRSDPLARVAANVLNRDFTANSPNKKWSGDITAVWTSEGWLYLAAVLDLFSRHQWWDGQWQRNRMKRWLRRHCGWHCNSDLPRLACYTIRIVGVNTRAMSIKPSLPRLASR